MTNQIAMYMHAGSGNHGCEAIVDSLTRMMDQNKMTLVTYSREEDLSYLPEEVRDHLDIEEEQHIDRHTLAHVLYYAWRLVTRDQESFLRYRLRPIQGRRAPRIAISIGGDNYCYDMMVPDLIRANSMLRRQGSKTVLLGCSIEPALLKDPALVADLKSYTRILARESLTYRALLQAGLPHEQVLLVPDPAFTLPADESALPEGFAAGNTVGINLSPMALDYAKDRETPLGCYEALIRHILETTNMDVALIPHVVWSRSDDRKPLKELYDRLEDHTRVRMIPDLPAEKIKGIIANCRFFVGARTHATIAAYSTLIPTLVIGYSVKARGIAQDLFGTDQDYVLPVQNLENKNQMIAAWNWLYEHEDQIHYALAGTIPQVRDEALQNAEEIRKIVS